MSQATDIIVKGGIVMIPLLACSLISLALTIERLFFWARIRSQQAVQHMLTLVETGEFDRLLNSARIASSHRSRHGCWFGAPQSRTGQSDGSRSPGANPLLKSRLGTLDTIITLAPLLGFSEQLSA